MVDEHGEWIWKIDMVDGNANVNIVGEHCRWACWVDMLVDMVGGHGGWTWWVEMEGGHDG